MDLKEKYEQLTSDSSVDDIQSYVKDMVKERGFEEETIKLLTEETGELAKSVRKTTGLKMDISQKDQYDIKGEIAYVFNYLLCMCNILDVSLYECYKEKRNLERNWK